MNKKFFISTAVLFVVTMALGFFVHGFLLHADYAQLPNLFRTEEDSKQYFAFMLAAHVIMSGALVWIYRRGKEDKPFLSQGLRFGLAVALLCTIPLYLIYYAVQPMPGIFVAKQITFETASMLGVGVVVAWLEK